MPGIRQLTSRKTRLKKRLIASNRRMSNLKPESFFAMPIKKKIIGIKDLGFYSSLGKTDSLKEINIYNRFLSIEKSIKKKLRVKSNSISGFGKKGKYYFISVFSHKQTPKLFRIINIETVNKIRKIEREITTKRKTQENIINKSLMEELNKQGGPKIFPFGD